jgi:large conductance mechanosensitive channel
MSMIDEFKKFISRGSVIDFAVGIIIGSAFTAIVSSLVSDIIMPPLGLVLGGIDFSDFFFALDGKAYPTLQAAKDTHAVTINYGLFINAIIKFLIVSGAVFLLVQQVHRIQRSILWEKETPPTLTPDQKLLTEIRDLLKGRAI